MIHFLAHCDPAIMAGCAVVRDTHVTKRRGDKSTCAEMADRAILGSRQMTGRLADTNLVVVARRAVADDTGMVKYRIGEVSSVVAHRAVLRGWHVINRFAIADYTIVA